MKKLILASTLAIISASSFAADDHSGFRVGGGFGTDIGKYQLKNIDGHKLSADPSVTIEAGYDFNKIFALNAKGSSMGFTDYAKSSKGKSTVYELAIEAEAGYNFDIGGRLSIKPYITAGVVTFDKDTSNLFFDENNALRARSALGARMTMANGVYVDGRIQGTDYTDKNTEFTGKPGQMLTQGMVTVGYKF
ncbi:porin family protein [Vibrio mexicanus]|uniref:porin family protein n=1 Tax=Vibrio mexicanus TaxID=1004326 RepID=UPI00063C0C0B|nr:porin family protein [Vibrio mexicanus]